GPARHVSPGGPGGTPGGGGGVAGWGAAELAGAWRPTLLIIGPTPEPTVPEPEETSGLAEEAAIKAALHARLRREGLSAGPADIEARYQALRRAREVRKNLDILARAGARVEYAPVDVRDPAALAAALGGRRAPSRA